MYSEALVASSGACRELGVWTSIASPPEYVSDADAERARGTSTGTLPGWFEGKTRNVYLGGCKKMSREEALARA